MSVEARYRLNADTATAKVIDGEAIVINVVTGRYYSLDGAAGTAWSLLVAGATATEAGDELAARYEVEAAHAASDVEELVAELAREELLAPATEPVNGPALPEANGERARYAKPVLTTFTDMEELLAFDPPLPPSDSQVWAASDAPS